MEGRRGGEGPRGERPGRRGAGGRPGRVRAKGQAAALTALRVGPEGGSTATEKRRRAMLFRQRFLDSVGFSKYT